MEKEQKKGKRKMHIHHILLRLKAHQINIWTIFQTLKKPIKYCFVFGIILA